MSRLNYKPYRIYNNGDKIWQPYDEESSIVCKIWAFSTPLDFHCMFNGASRMFVARMFHRQESDVAKYIYVEVH